MKNLFFWLCILFALTACSSPSRTQEKMTGPFLMRVSIPEAQFQVGRSATVKVILEKRSYEGCQLQFRQFMPGMEMDNDTKTVFMKRNKAHFVAESHELSMGGDWQFLFELTCENKTFTQSFDFHLEWPE